MNKPEHTLENPGQAGTPLYADPENPWLGLGSFTEDSRAYFFGREEEVAELCRRVQRKLLTILFGKSGLGKTSILQAGVVPKLRSEGYCPVYVRIAYATDAPSPADQIKHAIFKATGAQGQWTQVGVAAAGESLWEFLHHRDDVLRDGAGNPLIPLLIFDQFEEIFTLGQSDDAGRSRAQQFLDDLADLVENRPPRALEERLEEDETAVERFDFTRSDYRVLIALREDYLAPLEGLKRVMPSITQNRMRLAPMTGNQALAAVLGPGGRLVSEEVAAAIVRFVAGGTELGNAEVEPSLLSLICRELNDRRLAQGQSEITLAMLDGAHAGILGEFYERSIADQPDGVRRFIEDKLLTESGYRESVAEENVLAAFAEAQASPDALATLINRRLLRIEERLDARRVELTHDVLCRFVKESRDRRHARDQQERIEQQLNEQRDRARRARAALHRARRIAIACAALAVVAVVAAGYGYYSSQRAHRAEVVAEQNRAEAEKARNSAEELLGYLSDDLGVELAGVGRLDVAAGLAKRQIDYYRSLPEGLRSAATQRDLDLVLIRYGTAMRSLDRDQEAKSALEEGVAGLERARMGGDQSESTLLGLALGYSGLSSVYSIQGLDAKALDAAKQSRELIIPLLGHAELSLAARRAVGAIDNRLGFSQLRQSRFKDAVATFEEGRGVLAPVSLPGKLDVPAAVIYAESSGWESYVLTPVDPDRAQHVADEGLKIVGEVLTERPRHLGGLRARALIYQTLVELNNARFDPARALEAANFEAHDWHTLLESDPRNVITAGNEGAATAQAIGALQHLGRYHDVIALTEAYIARPLDPSLAHSVLLLASQATATAGVVEERASVGEDVSRYLPRALEARAALQKASPPGSYLSDECVADVLVATTDAYQGRLDLAATKGEKIAAELTKPKYQADNQIQGCHLDAISLAGYAALAGGDYARSERDFRTSLELADRLGYKAIDFLREVAANRSDLAVALAAQGRAADGAKVLVPGMAREKAWDAINHGDEDQHFEYAQALFAEAAVDPTRRAADLEHAHHLLQHLPAEVKQRVDIRLWSRWVDDAMHGKWPGRHV